MTITQAESVKNGQNLLRLQENTACLVVGGSSITTLCEKGEINKHSFYPKNLDEYKDGIVSFALECGRLKKESAGVLLASLAGAVQREGELVGLTENFRLVREDAIQRGMPVLLFKKVIEEEFARRGYKNIKVFGYNDAVPALVATLNQPNTEEILKDFERKLGTSDRSLYSLKYLINGTGTGEATLSPDTREVITAEKGHLKPNYLWYRLNPFFRYVTRLPIVGENRTFERTIAGGPTERSARHFSKILNAVILCLQKKQNAEEAEGIARVLGFMNYEEFVKADGPNGLLKIQPEEDKPSSLPKLGQAVKNGSLPAARIRDAFARALGTAMAHMNFVVGQMPDVPLNTFIGINEIRSSALGFIRSDGSTTALLGKSPEAWQILNQSAREYCQAYLGDSESFAFEILDINETFPHVHPDFGGLPALAGFKLNKL